MLIIKNATVYTMEQDAPLLHADILCQDKKIKAIGQDIDPQDAQVIDGTDLYVTPGLIDAHTHTGLNMTGAAAEQDANELTDPVTPQLDVIHSLDIHAPDFLALHREGVTSVCVIPGSGNVIGGQGIVVKTAGGATARELAVKDPAVIKCAMGGNPKSVYGPKSIMPATRMGVAAVLRDSLRRAKQYLEQKKSAGDDDAKQPPFDAKLETLLPVIRREIPLKVHCEQHDMVTLIRIVKEFNVDYTIEHGWACGLYEDELLAGGGTLCFGPIGIPEGYGECTGGDVAQVRSLDEKGLNVCLVTDYPLISDNVLLIHAGEAVRYGVPHQRALSMVTINAARGLKLEGRLGSIKEGKDADLVVWSAVPALDTSAKPLYTVIDGKIVYQK